MRGSDQLSPMSSVRAPDRQCKLHAITPLPHLEWEANKVSCLPQSRASRLVPRRIRPAEPLSSSPDPPPKRPASMQCGPRRGGWSV